MVIPKNGYIYIYVANESPTDVYFDNLQIIHKKSNVLELSDYYPYGLRNESLSYTGLSFDPANAYQYQDKELQTALGLNMHEFGLRHYDATIGRWGVQDPFMQFYNPYLAMGNNPVSIIDPTGGIGVSSQGNPKRATFEDPEYYRGGGGGRGIATVGGPMGWDGIGGDMYTTNATGGRDFDEDKYTEYIAYITGTSGIYGTSADGQSNYGFFSSYNKAMETVKFKSGAKIEYNSYTKSWGYSIRRIINEESGQGGIYSYYTIRYRDLGISSEQANNGGSTTTGVLTFPSLANQYISGGGNNYYLTKGTFNNLIKELIDENKIYLGSRVPAPGVEGLFQIQVSAKGTSYENSVGDATLYLNSTGFVGYSDWWNFEEHENGDRGFWNETKTTIGSFIPGNPFMVLFGITPPIELIRKH